MQVVRSGVENIHSTLHYITLHSSFFYSGWPLRRTNSVWVRVPKQVSLQFMSKHWQWWSRCDVFRETIPDPRASRSKWAVSNSDQPWWTNVKSVGRRWPQPALRRHVGDSMQLIRQVSRSCAMHGTVDNNRKLEHDSLGCTKPVKTGQSDCDMIQAT